MTCFCGKNAASWKIHGGRFGQAGDFRACDDCLPDLIRWVMQHPAIQPEPMVEVRLYTEN